MSKTEAEIVETNYGKLITIHEVDELGAKTGVYPVMKFGLKKARAVIKHIEEIKDYIKEMEK